KEGKEFPQDPQVQLVEAVAAVFRSWNGKRAVDYRNFHKIPHDLGTAANVQTMVFGNLGDDSGTGVVFTRNPATGDKGLYGEYLANAQGEDVVAGIRTPLKVAQLKEEMPKTYRELQGYAKKLETHYRDLQDIEFTVERGKLWILQTRAGKRTARAAVTVAVAMAGEKLISRDEAVKRVEPAHVIQLLMPRFDETAKAVAHKEGRYLAKGLNASPGAATGTVVFDPDEAQRLGREEKRPVILVRVETSPDDVHGMLWSKGILTTRGGATSHASVVARGLGLPCVVGAESIRVDYDDGTFSVGEVIVRHGDSVSIDGTTGEVFLGRIPTIDPDFKAEKGLLTILSWADKARRLEVWANADYPRDAIRAREFGAEGVGLCRTEHMFFEEDRLPIVQRMILAATDRERQDALDKLLPIQRGDFEGIFEAMGDLPVVIRLIDPPLHEFLPKYEDLLVEVTELRLTGKDPERLAEAGRLLKAVAAMREVNPMLGLRGCRLGIMVPGVTEMQVRAIFEAACGLKKAGQDPHPEIMIPLVGHVNELRVEREKLERVAKQVMKEQDVVLDYKFGTMIEVPRGALTADEIAKYAEFFSFGTNDLTQMTFGYSRDDAEGKFLMAYVERGILPVNPFQVLDRAGVGSLMRTAVEKGRKTRPDLKVGICGEHGGDPESIAFCHEIGLKYVSCSPYRVPVARIAAAHAALNEKAGPKGTD
ncbi:MAG: pyruvate, phosphate dikinase, partial [Methanobacteriota archaeon]